jgi:hypothetical protein
MSVKLKSFSPSNLAAGLVTEKELADWISTMHPSHEEDELRLSLLKSKWLTANRQMLASRVLVTLYSQRSNILVQGP